MPVRMACQSAATEAGLGGGRGQGLGGRGAVRPGRGVGARVAERRGGGQAQGEGQDGGEAPRGGCAGWVVHAFLVAFGVLDGS
jgi:hypothetical protein